MSEVKISPDLKELGETDLARIPELIKRMSDRDVYRELHNWYQNNLGLLDNYDWGDKTNANARELIKALPSPQEITEVEIAVFFHEIGAGNLEWSRPREVGDGLKVQDYYYGRKKKRLGELNTEERKIIEESPMRPFLFDKNPS